MSSRVGQINLPIEDQREEQLESRFLEVRDGIDGRGEVWGWVRTESGRAIYVAAYAAHRQGDETYMNIAFPLPWSNLTSILRLEHLPETPGGLLLTTRNPASGGDAGICVVMRRFPVRASFNETIRVWAVPDDTQSGALAARHDMRLCGVRFLTLHYAMYPQAARGGHQVAAR